MDFSFLKDVLHWLSTASPKLYALALLFPLAGMWMDRFWGADDKKTTAKLLTALAAVVAWVAGGIVPAAAVLLWGAYRSFTFKGGAAAPVNEVERKAAIRRHSWAPIMLTLLTVFAYTAIGEKPTIWQVVFTAVVFSLYAVTATAAAYKYGYAKILAENNGVDVGTRYNMKLERRRGLNFGIAFAVWVILYPWIPPLVAYLTT